VLSSWISKLSSESLRLMVEEDNFRLFILLMALAKAYVDGHKSIDVKRFAYYANYVYKKIKKIIDIRGIPGEECGHVSPHLILGTLLILEVLGVIRKIRDKPATYKINGDELYNALAALMLLILKKM